jgi:hypothetical protein
VAAAVRGDADERALQQLAQQAALEHVGSDLDVPGEWVWIRSFAPYPVHVGSGTNRRADLFWGVKTLVFEDPPLGDGAYLFDPQGDLRAWMTYPCLVTCTDPYQGALALDAVGRGSDERVTLRNVSGGAVDLDGYRLENPPYKYVFGTNAAVAPGETLTLEVQGDPRRDTRLVKHWGKSKRILDDDGDVVRLATFRDITLDCFAYGNARC